MGNALEKFVVNALVNWKSSLSGLLTFVIATGVYFSAVPSGVMSQKHVLIITLITGLAKVYLGLIQKD